MFGILALKLTSDGNTILIIFPRINWSSCVHFKQ